jgi:hypothetical protein
MIIHCTKKLAAKLPNVSKEALEDNNPLSGWHANLYVIDRRNCLMFCHDQTRFILVMTGLKKDDVSNLDFWFQDIFANTLLKLDYDTRLIEKVLSLLDPLQFDTSCDRSVQGTMRIAKLDFEAMLMRVSNVMELPVYSTSAQLNHRPVTIKGMKESDCLWPDREMKNWISDLFSGR